jgi:hypothetical protein
MAMASVTIMGLWNLQAIATDVPIIGGDFPLRQPIPWQILIEQKL